MAALYQQLCPVLFGDNAVGEMAKQIAEKGYKHVFICCDAGVRKAGIVGLVEDALKEVGLTYSMYDEILPDTPDTVVDELAAKIGQTGADIILAVGGGSTMDAAKAAGVEDRLGSIAVGKDADIAIFDGNPLETFTNTLYTIINGEIVYKQSRTRINYFNGYA